MRTARAAALTVALGAVVVATAPSSASAAAIAASGTAGRHASGPVVATDAGPVRGLLTGGTERFTGIPYAAPPVGALRWRPPQPVARRSAVRDATAFRPHCPQTGAFPFWGKASTSEDCLYLNVYTPVRRSAGEVAGDVCPSLR